MRHGFVEGDVNTSLLRKEWIAALDPFTKALLKRDETCFFRQSLSTPCFNAVKSADGIYLSDYSGKRYMDFHGNSVHQVGYGNPAVVDAVINQLRELSFSPRRYANEKAIELAESLIGFMPTSDYKVLFTPSGSISIGLALKMARRYTGRYKIVSLWDSFHGAGLDSISVGGEGLFRSGIGPLMPGCEHIMPYNSYRCVFGKCDACGLKCLDYLEYALNCEGDIGAVLMEPIRCTDVQIPPVEYYRRLRALCDKHGVVLMFDEIPTALGRTGKMYGFLNYDIQPDVLVLGKGLGGGLIPMSAVVARADMDVSPNISLGHYTHEKNPVGSAAALAVIDFIIQNGILDHAAEMGCHLKKRLNEAMHQYECIGDIRVIGLLAGIELVTSRNNKEKACELAEKILYDCLRRGLSFKVSQGNVLTLSPPLTITCEQLDTAIDIVLTSIGHCLSCAK